MGQPLPPRRRWAEGVVVLATLLAACSPASPTTTPGVTPTEPSSTTSRPPPTMPSVEEYLPGLEARTFLPTTGGAAALVVMVPGGGWRTADPAGLSPLASFLAGSGIAAVTVEVRAGDDGVTYPIPVEDVFCALGFALERVEASGVGPVRPLVVLGHSTGAHLAALAALAGPADLPECPVAPVLPDALVGISGTYDVSRLADVAVNLFGVGPDEDPESWERGNPVLRAGLRPEVPVLLLHGEADELVPPGFTEQFASVLEEGGHDVTFHLVAHAGHHEIYSADVAGRPVADWVGALIP